MLVCVRAICALMLWSLLQTQDSSAQSLIGWPRPLVALVGDDVVLPCLFRPLRDVSGLTLEWTRPDLDPRFVFVWRSHEELAELKNPTFTGRASLFTDELKHGNMSLRLTRVTFSDHGTYRCYVPGLGIDTTVELHVVVVGSPAVVSVAAVHVWRPAVELQCESEAWYPQPELQWLDSDGGPLSAHHSPPRPGPGGLYTVSSRLTVEHSGSFTCRVNQSSTNTTSQDTVGVTDVFFRALFWSFPFFIILVVVVVVALLVGLFVFLRWRAKLTSPCIQEPDAAEDSTTKPGENFPDFQDRNAKSSESDELYKKLQEKRHLKEVSERRAVIISHFDQKGQSFSLKNNSSEKQQIKDWEVEILVDSDEARVYKFSTALTLWAVQGEDTVTVRAQGCPTDGNSYKVREWDTPPWNTGKTALVSLYKLDEKQNKELVHVICEMMLPDRPTQTTT